MKTELSSCANPGASTKTVNVPRGTLSFFRSTVRPSDRPIWRGILNVLRRVFCWHALWRSAAASRRLLVAGALILGLFASGALAQDYIFTNFAASRDLPISPAPCMLLGSAQPVVYDTSIWLFYTCTDNKVIARRFYHDNDQADRATPRPVFLVSNPRVPPPVPVPSPEPCPIGMVGGRYGGCVPPDHPLAVGGGR